MRGTTPSPRATQAPEPAAAATPATKPRVARANPRNDDTYALVSKDRDGITMSGSTDDLDEIRSARRTLAGTLDARHVPLQDIRLVMRHDTLDATQGLPR